MHNGEKGFTLIELLVVMAIIATLMTLVAPRYFQQTERAREVVLKHNLNTLRISLDQFRRDHIDGPETLQELVDKGYLRQLPQDPITRKNDSWSVDDDEQGQIVNVHSGSTEKSLEGTAYAQW
ncbi:type II secretion system protein [Serratia proteamaculans]|uniref:Prepilin-type N-terminal cleavage/methylation domain-containing protein n=1 Tax=Serratia proteamaculans TaxID=28151 RepID=A0A5Q2VCA3_SERPR|nr:prepilin-type N-terminal cleavage/methylation domain-containing protein [Serratia proteamaculans]QGH61998.1 prepilin-type N-terminal cleavage/methylation domain-containing protein [Serratia proteamaculans]